MRNIRSKNIKWWIGTMSFLTLFITIGIFTFMKMNFVIRGVQIVASVNKSDDSSLVEIKGNAKNATHLKLNGREIFIEKDGTFKESIALLPGFSVIGIEASDKFGKTKEKKFEIVYEGSAPSVALIETDINTN